MLDEVRRKRSLANLAKSTLQDELGHSAYAYDKLARESTVIQDRDDHKLYAEHLRRRLEYIERMLANPYDDNELAKAVMWSTSNYETYRRDNLTETMRRIRAAITGPIPPLNDE